VGVVELFTEFTTGYWWGVVELFSKFTTGYWWGSWLLVGVVLLDLSFFVLCFQILIIPLVYLNSSYSLS
jgi:hypothetical protein